MASPALPLSHYTVAWICPKPVDQTAARVMLDQMHQMAPRTTDDSFDPNAYTLGSITGDNGMHHVVIAGLSHGVTGSHPAAATGITLKHHFPNIKIALVVEVGGGVPSRRHDLRLGDIVVGNGVVDYESQVLLDGNRVLPRGDPLRPSESLLKVVAKLEGNHLHNGTRVRTILQQRTTGIPALLHPQLEDKLFPVGSGHVELNNAVGNYDPDESNDPCRDCDNEKLFPRKPRLLSGPNIHIGKIASGNTLFRSGKIRESLGREDLGVLCFEMEALGLTRSPLECLPIRGISDYADSHKNDDWQGYAAATAAAYARELLEEIQPLPTRARNSQPMGTGEDHVAGTCAWLLSLPQYLAWLDDSLSHEHHGLLWIKGNPGSGKSTLVKFAFDEHEAILATVGKQQDPGTILISFFFNARGGDLEHNAAGMYRSLLFDLLNAHPSLKELFLDDDKLPRGAIQSVGLPILKKLFASAVLHVTEKKRLLCFIDALDECEREDITSIMLPFQDIARSLNERGGRFRAFCSSRYYRNLEPDIGYTVKLDETPGHQRDLRIYIEHRLCPDLKSISGLNDALFQRAQGSFLWAVLVIDLLNEDCTNGRVPRNFAELEQSMPQELYEVFEQIIKRDIESKKADKWQTEFQIAMIWILYARNPLDLEQFCHALDVGLVTELPDRESTVEGFSQSSLEMLKRRFINATKGLAEIKLHDTGRRSCRGSYRVQFIHESVRSFFSDNLMGNLVPSSILNSESLCHDRLKRYCLCYISSLFRAIGTPDWPQPFASPMHLPGNSAWPLAEYALNSVLFHGDAAASTIEQKSFLEGFSEEDFARNQLYLDHFCEDANLLHSCIRHGFRGLVLSGGFDRKLKDRTYLNPRLAPKQSPADDYATLRPCAAYLAVNAGSLEILQQLASWGTELDLESKATFPGGDVSEMKTHYTETPLILAAKQGKDLIAKFLIDHGVSLNQQRRGKPTALYAASRQAHLGIMKRLLAHGADVNVVVSEGSVQDTPLMAAARSGRWQSACSRSLQAVQLLLDAGADVNTPSGNGTALMQACNVEICRVLFDRGAKVSRGLNSEAAIRKAFSQDKDSDLSSHVLEFILEKGVNAVAMPSARRKRRPGTFT
ncbi:hypothetical protein CC79DRAFT_1389814 [Sarocladium strictum]